MNRRVRSVMFSSKRMDWETPQELFDVLDSEFHFTLDPCCSDSNAKCGSYFTEQEDGLVQDWGGETVFMNPPYGRDIGKWVRKAYIESRKGAIVVCLVPSRTDTKWWHKYAMRGEIRFFEGRLSFDGIGTAPFPSALVIFYPR